MRSSRFPLQSLARRWSVRRPSFTSMLLAGSLAAGAAQLTAFALTGQAGFGELGLSRSTVWEGSYWQFFTFAFLHANPLHLLANMLPLYLAGREVEPIMGRKPFLALFLLATFAGGLAQWAVMAVGWTAPGTVLVGVSAGVAAVVSAYATILPELEVTVLLFFARPLRVRAKRFGVGLVLLAVALWIFATATYTGPAAMLVGCLFGWLYAKHLGFGNPLAIERYFLERRQHALRLQRMPVEQFIAEEIDPVLEKLGRGGPGSLTRAEKRLLQQGSARLVEKK